MGEADLHTVQGKRMALQYATDFFSTYLLLGLSNNAMSRRNGRMIS
jgi:hypothetical protein